MEINGIFKFFVRMVYKPDPVNTLCLVTIHLDLLLPISSSDQPGLCLEKLSFAHESLLGLAPGGACLAFFVAKKAVSSYLTFSPLPNNLGGIFSVALSLKLPWPAVSWHHLP